MSAKILPLKGGPLPTRQRVQVARKAFLLAMADWLRTKPSSDEVSAEFSSLKAQIGLFSAYRDNCDDDFMATKLEEL